MNVIKSSLTDIPTPGPIPFGNSHPLPSVIHAFNSIMLTIKEVLAGWTENGESFCLIVQSLLMLVTGLPQMFLPLCMFPVIHLIYPFLMPAVDDRGNLTSQVTTLQNISMNCLHDVSIDLLSHTLYSLGLKTQYLGDVYWGMFAVRFWPQPH